MRPYLPAIILIALGVLFLLQNLGIADVHIGELVRKWWPLILIVLGVSMLFRNGSTRK